MYQGEIFESLKDVTQRVSVVHERWHESVMALGQLDKKDENKSL